MHVLDVSHWSATSAVGRRGRDICISDIYLQQQLERCVLWSILVDVALYVLCLVITAFYLYLLSCKDILAGSDIPVTYQAQQQVQPRCTNSPDKLNEPLWCAGVYDEAVEVLFDREFIGGSPLNGRVNGKCGAYVPRDLLLNTTHPGTQPLNKSSAPQMARAGGGVGGHYGGTGESRARPTSAQITAGSQSPGQGVGAEGDSGGREASGRPTSATPKVLMGGKVGGAAPQAPPTEAAARAAVTRAAATSVTTKSPAPHALPTPAVPFAVAGSPAPPTPPGPGAATQAPKTVPAKTVPAPPQPSPTLMARALAAAHASAPPPTASAPASAPVARADKGAQLLQQLTGRAAPVPQPPPMSAGAKLLSQLQPRGGTAGAAPAPQPQTQGVMGGDAAQRQPQDQAQPNELLSQLMAGSVALVQPSLQAPLQAPSVLPQALPQAQHTQGPPPPPQQEQPRQQPHTPFPQHQHPSMQFNPGPQHPGMQFVPGPRSLGMQLNPGMQVHYPGMNMGFSQGMRPMQPPPFPMMPLPLFMGFPPQAHPMAMVQQQQQIIKAQQARIQALEQQSAMQHGPAPQQPPAAPRMLTATPASPQAAPNAPKSNQLVPSHVLQSPKDVGC